VFLPQAFFFLPSVHLTKIPRIADKKVERSVEFDLEVTRRPAQQPQLRQPQPQE
jgi:hypothetical protein